MTVWKLGIDLNCSNYRELSARHVVAQGWPGTGDLSFLFGSDINKTQRWLKTLHPEPNTAKAQRTLTNLLSKIKAGDIILGYEGNTLAGICQIPNDFVYIYQNSHASCVTCTPTGHCEYAHCLFPVNWVDWNTFISSLPPGTPLPTLSAGQGIPGIVENHDNPQAIENAWQAYVKRRGHSVTPIPGSPTAIDLSGHQTSLAQRRIDSLGQISCEFIKRSTEDLEAVIKTAKQLIFYGPPGTGKTYLAKALAAKLLNLNPCNASAGLASHRFRNGNGFWDIVQFHPSYCYEDFVGGIRPALNTHTLSYTLAEGIFKQICDAAFRDPDHNYVLIIDEINRANLPAVLGELLYALEYRGEPVSTPNNGNIVVPENLYIIGTMNNIDKSLATFDVALQRRFAFKYIDSDINIAHAVLYYEFPTSLSEVDDYVERCWQVSREITEKLHLPSDRPIGHSYFIRIKDYLNQPTINPANPDDWKYCRGILWDYHILPLIEEYLGKRYADCKNILDDIRQGFVD